MFGSYLRSVAVHAKIILSAPEIQPLSYYYQLSVEMVVLFSVVSVCG